MLIGAMEAGGTKFVCGVGTREGEILEHVSFPTEGPEETMAKAVEFFSRHPIQGLGVGTFGPADINPESPTYGSITTTPKLKWAHYPMLPELQKHFHVPAAFDTDVNAAALGELTWGAARGLDSCMYMTVGTGIGVGAVVDGKVLHGMNHPEMGHILVRRHPNDTFAGACPYHGDCLEGLAAGPALEKRWGAKGIELADRPEVWEIQADYLAQALVSYALIFGPKRMILGGGVMKQQQLFPLIREKFKTYMNSYLQNSYLDDLDTYIVPPGLQDFAGLKGSIALAVLASKVHSL
ncbi:ROK family protein [Bacillus mangrovi]|uniref:fructokinase n=1 Tax=Metabacillus mangrovi TaxID=1491830 RepID=A0A7X2V4A2_9BACI|nr:ROK family protein [Metabacillus mangrovi]MTH53547.1 ROK family protein [Metabacillus mangrovi]